MLKQRFLTALILIPIILFLLCEASNEVFSGLMVLILLGCAFEWLNLIPLKSWWTRLGFVVLAVMVTWIVQRAFYEWLWVNVILWVFVFIAVLRFPSSERLWGFHWVVAVAGLLVLPTFVQSMINIHQLEHGKALIFYLLLLVWAADTGAYLIGKRYGRHALIPAVSPGKTFEGALGGGVLSLLVAAGGYVYFDLRHPVSWFFLALSTTLISMLGDLLISLLKRRVKIKDTGALLPGHGGVLDRLDSLIAASALFYFGLIHLGFLGWP